MKASGANKSRPLYGPLGIVLALLLAAAGAWAEWSSRGSSESLELNQSQLADARREAEAKIPRLPADTEARLASAYFPQLPPVSTAVDPSSDRFNLGGGKSAVPSFRPPTPAPGPAKLGPQPPAAPSEPDFATRYGQWLSEYQSASRARQQPPPRTRAYLLSELSPAGRFGRKGSEGVWFKSAADRSEFYAAVGTQFYDAELVGVGPAGPVFRLKNGTTRTVKYAAPSGEPAAIQPSSPPAQQSAEKSPGE